MPSWIAKAAVQGVLSIVPGGRSSNRWLQDFRRTTGPGFFDEKLELCRHHLSHHFELGGRSPSTPFHALELGSGRVPLVPMGLALCGAVRVTSLDLVDMVHPELTRRAMRYLLDEADAGRLERRLPWIRPDRIDDLRKVHAGFDAMALRENLSRMGVELRIQDVCRLPAPSSAYDLIVSNNTFEHIVPGVLDEIFAAFRRLASPGVTMSHFIDLVDHYAHFDRRLTPYNFLRFRPGVWRLLNNPLQYQNRLRVSDYRDAHSRAGFRIVLEENDDSGAAQLDCLQVAPEFRHYSRQDLAVTSSWMVSRLDGPGAGPHS